MRFLAAARPAQVAKGRQALAALNGAAVAAWRRCLADIGAEEELVASGYLLVWESGRGRAAGKAQMAHLRHHAEALLRDPTGLDDGAEEWMGFRPTLPDSLPVIDRHPAYPAVHFAFGHQHLG